MRYHKCAQDVEEILRIVHDAEYDMFKEMPTQRERGRR